MAQALIKSLSNNKPPEQCAGSGLELAVQWQEPRGTRHRGRVKRELPHGGAAQGDGGEGLVGGRAQGHSDISRVLAGSGGSPRALAGGAEPPQSASTLLKTVSAVELEAKQSLNALDEGSIGELGVLVPGGCRGRGGDTPGSAGKCVAAKPGCTVPGAPRAP